MWGIMIAVPVVLLATIVWSATQVVTAIRTGRIRGQIFRIVRRDEQPIAFWSLVITNALCSVVFGSAMICIAVEVLFRI